MNYANIMKHFMLKKRVFMNNLHLKDSVCMNNLHLTASFMPFSILTPNLLGWSKQFVGGGGGVIFVSPCEKREIFRELFRMRFIIGFAPEISFLH